MVLNVFPADTRDKDTRTVVRNHEIYVEEIGNVHRQCEESTVASEMRSILALPRTALCSLDLTLTTLLVISCVVPHRWGYVCEEIDDFPDYIPDMGCDGESKAGATPGT